MEEEKEEWRDVNYWPNYIVSSNGEVARKDTGQILKQYIQKSGYSLVWLSRGHGNCAVPVHRIVCIAFHGEKGYMDGLYVDHIDTNRSNNKSSNLHWVTPKENSRNPLTMEKRKRKKDLLK